MVRKQVANGTVELSNQSGCAEVWSKDGLREKMLAFLRQIDRESSLIGASAHLLALARKPT